MSEKYITLKDGELINVQGIPFMVQRDGEIVKSLPLNQKIQIDATDNCSYAYLLGMVMNDPQCSEWWQQEEANYANHTRVFLGDNLCFIFIVYEDLTQEIVPAIFGYNAWNYELYSKIQPFETQLNTYGGPYREPFESDIDAKKLFDDSLCLNETEEGQKCTKYIMAVKLSNKPVKCLSTRKFPAKTAGLCISSITCLKSGFEPENPNMKVVDPAIFLNRGYQLNLEKLARRLYQFKDDVPEKIEHIIPENYVGPKVNFIGSNVADVLTNVYHFNMQDMAENKVTADGMPHTSSQSGASFGLYVGMGTFKRSEGGYFTHIWTRDVGRVLIELAMAGVSDRLELAADKMHHYLYDPSSRFTLPNWKRIANAYEQFGEGYVNMSGKENDGHASIMMFMYQLIRTRQVSKAWVESSKKQILDAANWFFWQIEKPAESNFDKVLYSDSEASSGDNGGYDLFSNAISYYALLGYKYIGEYMGWDELAEKCAKCAAIIKKGIYEVFIQDHPKYGKIFVDNTYDAWTYEYKRFGILFEMADHFTYEPMSFDDELAVVAKNTMKAQMDEFYTPYSGRQMGYGQGYITQTMLLMDNVAEYSKCIEASAFFCYHNHDLQYIVPEGVITHPTKRYWFRNSDLGNAVQQAETIKSIRLMLGLEDLNPQTGINIIPRLPLSFDKMEISNYKLAKIVDGEAKKVAVEYCYSRIDGGYKVSIAAAEGILLNTIRFGPYAVGVTPPVLEYGVSVKTIEGYDYIYIKLDKEIKKFTLSI